MGVDFTAEQDRMVQNHLRIRGVTDPGVLDAFRRVPRHEFVRNEDLSEAYTDHPLPIGEGQTISQPYIVALMTQSLELTGREKVLEIGTGSGYQTAIASLLAGKLYSVERVESLLKSARERLARLGFNDTEFMCGDGTLGWEEHAPYDAIIVTAAPPDIPAPLTGQLADGGRMVIPIGHGMSQDLVLVTNRGGEMERKRLCGCVFVKLVGKQGWKG